MSTLAKRSAPTATLQPSPTTNVTTAYNHAGAEYLSYADGDPSRIYAFDSLYAYGDRHIWALLDAKLVALRSAGADSLGILDAGCGPGTWLRRIIVRAQALGFARICARGFDLADEQIRRARQLGRGIATRPGVKLTFEVADITRPLPEADTSVDLTLCLYGVLNHLPVASLPDVISEIARVTSGSVVMTVRAIGSTPTIYVDDVDRARDFHQDHVTGRFDIELRDGTRLAFHSHLFRAAELRQLVAPHLDVDELRGLDLFHTRFALDPRWNPAWLIDNQGFRGELARLENTYSANPEFIDRAAHLLLVARGRRTRG